MHNILSILQRTIPGKRPVSVFIYFELPAYLRIARSIVSAWVFVDIRSNEQISLIGWLVGGCPISRSVIIANKAPEHAPRFPSQCSGLGSSLKNKKKTKKKSSGSLPFQFNKIS